MVSDALDQRRPASRDQAVDHVGELHQLDRRLVAHVVDQQHAVGRQARLRRALAQDVGDGDVRAQSARRAPQQGHVARLEADAGGVAGDVGTVLVDDRDHSEWHAHPLDPQPVRPSPTFDHLTDRIGEGGDVAQALGHAGDPLLGQTQAVERTRLHALCPGGIEVRGVGVEDLGGALAEQVGGGEQRRVLHSTGRDRQLGRRRLRAPSQFRDGGPGHSASVPVPRSGPLGEAGIGTAVRER